MEKIIKRLIDESICDADSYFHDGSAWLIFTEKKEWVFELKENGVLWYNYYFFKHLFSYLSMDVIENQHYITKYVEDVIQNGVKNTFLLNLPIKIKVEDVIQNGVKNTLYQCLINEILVEDVIQNGVKNTMTASPYQTTKVEDVIQNGVINKFMGLFGTNR